MIHAIFRYNRLFVFAVLLLSATLWTLSACSLGKQKSALKNFENCQIEIVGISSLQVSGTDLTPLLQNQSLDLKRLPGLAMGFLAGSLPLNTTLKVQITNPTRRIAGVKEFEYKLAVENHELLSGIWDEPIEVPPGETLVVAVPIQTDIYPFVRDQQVLQKIMGFFQAGEAQDPVSLTLQLKPTLELGNKKVAYPRFIRFERKLTKEMLIDRRN
jgi:hypothetical protein